MNALPNTERSVARRTVLTLTDLRKAAPSVFATHASKKMTESYSFVPSMKVVEALDKVGLVPVDAGQRKAKGTDADMNSARHLVRFAHKADLEARKEAKKGDFTTEVVMVNSHNGRTAFKLYYGIFVFACANGLIVADTSIGMSRRHSGDVDSIMRELDDVMNRGPQIVKLVRAMKDFTLTAPQRLAFAEQALALRYSEEEKGKMVTKSTLIPDQLLIPRRDVDKGDTLWKVFNVVQENLVVGGLTGKSATGRATHTRKLQDVRKVVSINTGLWELAQKTMPVKAAA